MLVEAPLGDVVDRLAILAIKRARLPTAGARANAEAEAASLLASWSAAGLPAVEAVTGWDRLVAVNTALWEVEDRLRAHERDQAFGDAFVALARAVYRLNDLRAALKRVIIAELGSRLTEEKSYGTGRPDQP
jgi:hypothetical protein